MEKENRTDLAIQEQINLLKLYIQEQINLLKLYLFVSIGSFVAFVIFVLILIGSNWLSKLSPDVGIIVRIVAWPLTVLSAICCIVAVLSSFVGFLWFLIRSFRFLIKGPPKVKAPPQVKTPPQKKPGQEAADEGRDE